MRAVVFTDIEGSTRLLRELGARYDAVLSRHHALLREAMVGGEVIGVEGDAFLVLFDRAAEALEACVVAQSLLAREPWPPGGQVRVRMGVHAGEVRGGSQGFVGLGLHQAARVVPAGHGGQIVVTSALVDALAGTPPADIGVLSLGTYYLRDFDGPQELFQVLHADIDRTFPPLRVPSAGVHNLPPMRTSFVGRATELSELIKATELAPLVTLVGPGGVGKTRLAGQTGLQVAGRYPYGVWLVPLSRITRPEEVAGQVKTAMGLPDQPGRTSSEVICDALRAGPRLLILDNCEHVLDGCVALIEELLEHSDSVRVLATSREHLGLDGEVVIRLDPLDLPGSHPGEPVSGGAVELFTARACQARRDFALTAENAVTVASICTRLDGIPLALELAAARLSTVSLTQLHQQLDDALQLLESGRRGGEMRQRTLRAALEWSYQLLSPPERAVFAGLSVFRGGFTLQAAQAVLVVLAERYAGVDVPRGLEQLVAQSMLELNAATEPPRYRLLQIVRAYADGCLRSSGDKPALLDAHARYHAELIHRQGEPGATLTTDALQLIATEQPNLLAAMEHLAAADQVDAHGQLLIDLARFWHLRGHWQLAKQQYLAFLSRPATGSPRVRGQVLGELARVLSALGDASAAEARWEESLRIARELGDRHSEGAWLGSLGSAASDRGDYALAASRYADALGIAKELGDRVHEGYWIGNLGTMSIHLGDLAAARVHLTQALEIARELGDLRTEDVLLGSLAVVDAREGRYDEARARVERALSIARELGARARESASLCNLGVFASAVGDNAEARARYEEALVIARELGARPREAELLGNLGLVAHNRGDLPEASARFEQAVAVLRQLGDRRSEGLWLSSLGAVLFDAADYRGARARWEEALVIVRELGDRRGEGDRLASIGRAAAALDDHQQAKGLLEQALAIAQEVGDRAAEGERRGRLASIALDMEDLGLATADWEVALDIARELRDQPKECRWLGWLGWVDTAAGSYREATERYRAALLISRQTGYRHIDLLDGCARLLVRSGHAEQSAQLLAAADVMYAERDIARSGWRAEQYDATRQMCAQQRAGSSMSLEAPADWDTAVETALLALLAPQASGADEASSRQERER